MKIRLIFALIFISVFSYGQSVKISDMTSATTLSGAEYVPIVQTGANKKSAVSLLRGFGSYGTVGQYPVVNGTSDGFDFVTPPFLSAYPGAGIAVSTGSAWGPSITDNSTDWNTAFGWGDHAGLYQTPLTFSNGLTNTAGAIKLGGSLVENTTINGTDGEDFTIRLYGVDAAQMLRLESYDDMAGSSVQLDITAATFKFNDTGLGFTPFGYDQGGGIELNFFGGNATGDTYQRNSGGYVERLPIGANTYVLTSNGTTAGWAAPSGGWATTGTTNLTGATTIAGTTTNTLQFQFPSLGTTYSNVFMLNNPTAAAAGAQQLSPSLTLRGNGWKTNATAASQTVDFIQDVTPVQGAANPTGYMSIWSSINGAARSENVRYRSDGSIFLTGGSGFAANVFFGTAGDSYISRGTSGTNGMIIYGPSSTANIYTLSVLSNSTNYAFTGTGGSLALNGNWVPTIGAGNMYYANTTGTINMTGTSSGNVFNYGVNQTVTAALGNYTGFYHNPTVTSITGQHNALHAVTGDIRIGSGNLIMGTGSTTTQGQVIHNVGTTGSDVYRRSVEWTPETVSASSGNEDYNVFLSDGITNSTCTVIVTVVGVSSDGVKSYAKEMKATFRKPGTSDLVQVGSTHDIYEDSNDLTTPSSSVSVSTDFVRVSYDSGTGAPTLRWTIFLTTKYSTN